MKMRNAGILMAVGALSLTGAAGMSVAAPAAQKAVTVEARAESQLQRAEAFRNSLKPAQIDALLEASRGWQALAKKPDVAMTQVERDLARILPPAQAREFMRIIEPGIAGGGIYRAWICWANSKLSLTFSMVGLIGCPSQTAEDAFLKAYVASVYANTCLVERAESCDAAAYAALDAYVLWSQLEGSCDLADTAMLTSIMTYAGCGGTW